MRVGTGILLITIGLVVHQAASAASPSLSIDQINRLIDQELGDPPPASHPITQTATIEEPPRELGWSSEVTGLLVPAVQVSYLVSQPNRSDGPQHIRFHIQNPNIERAAIAFKVDLVSERGQFYRNVVGAVVEAGQDLAAASLELLPFDPGDRIVSVQFEPPMVCAEPAAASFQTASYHDDCQPVHSAVGTTMSGK